MTKLALGFAVALALPAAALAEDLPSAASLLAQARSASRDVAAPPGAAARASGSPKVEALAALMAETPEDLRRIRYCQDFSVGSGGLYDSGLFARDGLWCRVEHECGVQSSCSSKHRLVAPERWGSSPFRAFERRLVYAADRSEVSHDDMKAAFRLVLVRADERAVTALAAEWGAAHPAGKGRMLDALARLIASAPAARRDLRRAIHVFPDDGGLLAERDDHSVVELVSEMGASDFALVRLLSVPDVWGPVLVYKPALARSTRVPTDLGPAVVSEAELQAAVARAKDALAAAGETR